VQTAVCVCVSFVKTYDEVQDSTLGAKKRKVEEVTDVVETKPKKAKLSLSTPTATTSGTDALISNYICTSTEIREKNCYCMLRGVLMVF